jgi:hypothetical protein
MECLLQVGMTEYANVNATMEDTKREVRNAYLIILCDLCYGKARGAFDKDNTSGPRLVA